MNTTIQRILSVLVFSFVGILNVNTAYAKIGPYNVIAVGGFDPLDPYNLGVVTGIVSIVTGGGGSKAVTPLSKVIEQQNQPLVPIIPDKTGAVQVEDTLEFSSGERMENEIAQRLKIRAIQYAKAKFCEVGCILSTGSTGDLVARIFLARQKYWLAEAGLPPLKIVATLDESGAGFGSDMADLLQNPLAPKLKFLLWKNWGVLEDLQTSVARTIAMEPQTVPRLRYANFATGMIINVKNIFLSFMTSGKSPIKPNDGLVAGHSSCGATETDYKINSCSKYASPNGMLVDDKRYPPKQLISNFFPVLMRYGDGWLHSGAYQAGKNQALTPAFPVSATTVAPAVSATCNTSEGYAQILPYKIDVKANKVWFEAPNDLKEVYYIDMIDRNWSTVNRAICS